MPKDPKSSITTPSPDRRGGKHTPDIENLRAEMLDYIYTVAEGSTGRFVDLKDFAAEYGLQVGTVYGLVFDCDRQGLVVDASSLGSPCAALTPSGIQEVQARRRRRADPALRSAAARNGLLRWLYNQDLANVHMPITNKFLESEESIFEGDQLTQDEIDRAAEYLYEKQLIKGVPAWGARGPLRAEITHQGRDCVENYGGNVAEYLRDQRSGGPSINTTIGTINNSGAIAVASTGATQNVTSGTDPSALAAFAKTLLTALPNLSLPREVAGEAEQSLKEVAEAGTDTERAASAFRRFVSYLVDAGKPVVTDVMMWIARNSLPSI